MLTRIRLKNFKLHADTTIDAAPITIFIGPNSSGKSSIFQSMLLWRQAATRNSNNLCTGVAKDNRNGSPYVFAADQLIDIGDFSQIVRHGATEVGISVSGRIPESSRIEYGPGPTGADLEIRVRENRLVYQRGKLSYDIRSRNISGEVGWEWPAISKTGATDNLVRLDVVAIIVESRAALDLLQPHFSFTGPLSPEVHISATELGTRVVQAPTHFLQAFHPVLPLRGFEESGYPLAGSPAEALDRMALQDRTIALLSVLAYNRDVERRISAWLADLANLKIEVKLIPGGCVTILCSPVGSSSMDSLFSNEGTGANQLPFILVPIGLTPQGETILLSEPEVHLHPHLQTHLMRLLIQLVKREKRQFFIETHSEHVLHALLNAVAKQEIGTSDLAIYYFENEHGTAKATRLQVDESGAIPGGLPGFFDQTLGELTEYLGALKNK